MLLQYNTGAAARVGETWEDVQRVSTGAAGGDAIIYTWIRLYCCEPTTCASENAASTPLGLSMTYHGKLTIYNNN
jgi:hypothetical protein